MDKNKQKQDKLILVIIELWIYDFITFSIVFIIGLIFGYAIQTVIYIFFFSWIRQYCGGYHADTRNKCMASYFMFYSLFLLMLYYSELSLNTLMVINVLSGVYIVCNAPVQHCNHPLTLIEQKDNRHKAIRIVSVVIVIQILLYLLNSNWLINLTFVLGYSAILMIIQKRSKNYRGNDL